MELLNRSENLARVRTVSGEGEGENRDIAPELSTYVEGEESSCVAPDRSLFDAIIWFASLTIAFCDLRIRVFVEGGPCSIVATACMVDVLPVSSELFLSARGAAMPK